MEKRPFFRAAMAGLGKYRMGGYGRIGVYRVEVMNCEIKTNKHQPVTVVLVAPVEDIAVEEKTVSRVHLHME